MVYRELKSYRKNRVIFVWDGNKRSVEVADIFASTLDNVSIVPVQVLPHESIYAYGTVGHTGENESSEERQLHKTFEEATRFTTYLRGTKLELYFGERIVEIARLVSILKASYVLMPSFKQSVFSGWVHGDLNLRVKDKASCPVFFYESGVRNCRLLTDGTPSSEPRDTTPPKEHLN